MKRFSCLFLCLTLLSIGGCSSNGAFFSDMLSEDLKYDVQEKMAELTDYQLKDGFINISVVGYGCTFVNSYKVVVANKKDNVLAVVQTRPDECNMTPRNVSLQYSFKHLGFDPDREIRVKNMVNVSQAAN